MDVPTVIIVGRPNVGKSSLFNAICGRRVAIVDPTAGVTRDRISRVVEAGGAAFELVDTGGMGLHDSVELVADIEMQILMAVELADLVLLVVDARAGVQPGDQEIARRMRDAAKNVLLVVNKCDNSADEAAAADFYELGLPEMHLTAAIHRTGIADLMRAVAAAVPEAPAGAAPAGEAEARAAEPMRIAFVGRRNVGKSTLVNYLADAPRVIVSEIPGTTRDSVDVRFRMDGLEFVAIDTAGLRRRKQIKDSIDFYSVTRTRRAIRRADVVVHIMEAPMEISRIDKQIASEVADACKPCMLAMNKMDLAGDVSREEFTRYVRDRLPGANYFPVAYISALTGEGVQEMIEAACTLHDQSFIRVATGELNRAVQEAVRRTPPPSAVSHHTKIYYATQVGVRPPTVVLFTNEPAMIGRSYQRYLGNALRRSLPFHAIPIRFLVRGRRPAKERDSAR